MDRGSVVAGAPFRAALYAAMLFGVILFGSGWLAYQRVDAALQQNIEAQILEEQILLHEILKDGGGGALKRAVEHLNSPLSTQRHMVGLFDDKGQFLGGNIALAPDFVGWKTTSLRNRTALGMEGGHLLNAARQGQFLTVVGRSLAPVGQTLTTLIEGLLILGAVVFVTILMLGYLLSRKSLAKLQTIEQTLNQISKGDMAARLPVSSANDQIDRISKQVNHHLERLSALMFTTKSSVAAIAHDLKTPLSHSFIALQQAISQLDQRNDPRPRLEELESELQRLSSIFDTILRISRIETSDSRTYFDDVDLNDLVHEMGETFQPVAEENGQTLKVPQESNPAPIVWADHKMLQQMVYNLVSNAVEHCPRGTEIILGVVSNEIGAELTIADNGPGVTDKQRASIFDPFFRANSSRSTGGNGLGLALVRAIATRHGAKVRAYDNHPGLKICVVFPDAKEFQKLANL